MWPWDDEEEEEAQLRPPYAPMPTDMGPDAWAEEMSQPGDLYTTGVEAGFILPDQYGPGDLYEMGAPMDTSQLISPTPLGDEAPPFQHELYSDPTEQSPAELVAGLLGPEAMSPESGVEMRPPGDYFMMADTGEVEPPAKPSPGPWIAAGIEAIKGTNPIAAVADVAIDALGIGKGPFIPPDWKGPYPPAQAAPPAEETPEPAATPPALVVPSPEEADAIAAAQAPVATPESPAIVPAAIAPGFEPVPPGTQVAPIPNQAPPGAKVEPLTPKPAPAAPVKEQKPAEAVKAPTVTAPTVTVTADPHKITQALGLTESYSPVGVQAVLTAAAKHGYDPMIPLALAYWESGGAFNPKARGDNGASIGLFQFHTRGGQGTGIPIEKLEDPDFNADTFLRNHKGLYDSLVAKGLRGRDLAIEFGRLAERPAAGNEKHYGESYDRLSQKLAGVELKAAPKPGLSTGGPPYTDNEGNILPEQPAGPVQPKPPAPAAPSATAQAKKPLFPEKPPAFAGGKPFSATINPAIPGHLQWLSEYFGWASGKNPDLSAPPAMQVQGGGPMNPSSLTGAGGITRAQVAAVDRGERPPESVTDPVARQVLELRAKGDERAAQVLLNTPDQGVIKPYKDNEAPAGVRAMRDPDRRIGGLVVDRMELDNANSPDSWRQAEEQMRKGNISSNYVIQPDGRIVRIVPESAAPQALGGEGALTEAVNRDTLGVTMLTGPQTGGRYTPAQIQALKWLMGQAGQTYGVTSVMTRAEAEESLRRGRPLDPAEAANIAQDQGIDWAPFFDVFNQHGMQPGLPYWRLGPTTPTLPPVFAGFGPVTRLP
jgi:hypothetical protein